MSKYVYTAFDVRGRAEVVRFMFAAAGVKYEDRRIKEFDVDVSVVMQQRPEDWVFSAEFQALQPKLPFNQVPTLEVDGAVISFNKPIQAFLGKRLGLAGRTDLDEAKVATISEFTHDIFTDELTKILLLEDQERKAKLIKKYTEEDLPRHLNNLEKAAGNKGHFVADKLTYADLTFYQYSKWLAFMQTKLDLSKHPKLKAICENVEKNPGIAKWMKERPADQFQS